MSNKKYAVMPYTDYADICDSTRGLTSAPKEIKSGEVKTFIEQGRNIRNSIIEGTTTELTPSDLQDVVGIGTAFRGCPTLNRVELPDHVRTIDAWAFSGSSELRSVILPRGQVLSILDGAFSSTAITEIIIPGNTQIIPYKCFSGCVDLENVVIEEGVSAIKESAFQSDNSLTTITIPESMTQIEDFAFGSCSSLTDVYYSGNRESWLSLTIGIGNESLTTATIHYGKPSNPVGCDKLDFVSNGDGTCYIAGRGECSHTILDIPPVSPSGDVVTKIGNEAFSGDYILNEVTIPDTVTTIGASAFDTCYQLCRVTLGNAVKSIEENAFRHCGLSNSDDGGIPKFEINFPPSLIRIGKSSFESSVLKTISLPASVTIIEEMAFASCGELDSIDVDINNSVYHSFGNCLIETDTGTLLLGSKNSVIPDDGSVRIIGDYAFMACHGLTSLVLPSPITSIGRNSFNSCANLTTINIPDGVTIIRSGTFTNCRSLTSISLPDSVTEIAPYSFDGCESLTSFTVGTGLSYIGSGFFDYCEALTDIYYADSLPEWLKITIEPDFNSRQSEVSIHCAKELPITIFYAKDLLVAVPTPVDDTIHNLDVFATDNNYITYTYITYTPLGEDPFYYPLRYFDGGRYLNISYRTTTATGMWLQVFLGSSGDGPADATSMLQIPIIADGEWQIAKFDLQELIDRGVYDGSYVSYFRFDAIDGAGNAPSAGSSLDVRYMAFFETAEGASQPESNFFNLNHIETVTAPISKAFNYIGRIDILDSNRVVIDGYKDNSNGSVVIKPGIVSDYVVGNFNTDGVEGDEKALIMEGWALVNGGQDGYFWSVDGQNWAEVTKGTYGVANGLHQAACLPYGVDWFVAPYGFFTNMVIDLSAYRGQTIPNLYVAVRSKLIAGSPAQQKMCHFLTFTNLVVPS